MKKYQEDLLSKTDGQILTLEQMSTSIEFAMVETKVIQGIKEGNQVLKQINEEMSLEDVEKLMEETADAIAYQNHVSDLLSGQYQSAEDEDAIMAELAQLQELEAMETKDKLAQVLPSVSKVPLEQEKVAEEATEEPAEEEESRVALEAS